MRARFSALFEMPRSLLNAVKPFSSSGLSSVSRVSVRTAGFKLMVFLLGGADYEDGQVAGVLLGKCPCATFVATKKPRQCCGWVSGLLSGVRCGSGKMPDLRRNAPLFPVLHPLDAVAGA
jgi:hypothetical protein